MKVPMKSLALVLLLSGLLVAGCTDSNLVEPEQEAASLETETLNLQTQDVRQNTFGNLIAALNNINAQIRALENVNVEDVEVRVVNVEDVRNILNDNQVNVLNNALRDADIDALQNFLNENNVLNEALNQNNIAIQDVVAVNVLSGGDIVIYAQEQ